MNILHLLATADPRAGGPTECVKQGSAHLATLGHHVEVLTLDDPQAPWLTGFTPRVHALGPARGHYHFSARLAPWLREHARSFDAVIVNGLWQYHSYGAWQVLHTLGVPYYVFPHGMLDPWFKRTYPLKHLKKWLYWPWAEYRVLRDAQRVLFTAEEERQQARLSFWLYRAREAVVSFGTTAPPGDPVRQREQFYAAYPELAGKRLILFLGRIHEKKGCDLLVEAFGRLAQLDPRVHLVMAGPDPGGWSAALKLRAQHGGVAARITWTGMLQGELKWGAFRASDAFALPSHQENFGIAVAEALGCGVPALISNKVNIWREVQADGAGLVAPDTLAGTVANLQAWLLMEPARRDAMRRRAALSFKRRFTIDKMCSELLRVIDPQAATGTDLARQAAHLLT
jgi:glycosyltransferase involved in cell wall biosynthesis